MEVDKVSGLMQPRLYDTMSRTVREMKPVDGKTFRFYCCGPTVYGPAHIGNFRTFLMQDVFRRTLEVSGIKTRHVRNITDVDDKTIRQSMAEGRTLAEFTAHWSARYHEDCRALNILEPHVEPGAVEHIPQQVAMIEALVARKHAYVAGDGSVYFSVASFPEYGRLSRLKEREVMTGASGAGGVEDADEYQRDSAADFALWKSAKPGDGDNHWAGPWGLGRPGWHIECSAMAHEYLGHDLDLHSGGIDLVFPHHENEIAQSECCHGPTFAHHWFHIAHLMVERQKMSKSLGNLFTLEDVRARGFTAVELRYVLISGHYRQPLNFTWESLQAARSALGRLRRLRDSLDEVAGGRAVADATRRWGSFEPVAAALADDLNTPEALGRLFRVGNELEPMLGKGALKPDDAAAEMSGLELILQALGLDLDSADAERAAVSIPEEIRELADSRWQARTAKNWAESDRMRDELAARGWVVKDGKDGYELEPSAK